MIFISAINFVAKYYHVDFLNQVNFLNSLANKDSITEIQIEIANTVNCCLEPLMPYDFFQRIFYYFIYLISPDRAKDLNYDFQRFLGNFVQNFMKTSFCFY